MRVDSHHHLWTRAKTSQPWIDSSMAAIDRDFEVSDYQGVAGPYVDRSVLVQTASSIAETEQLLDIAAATPTVGAVVGWVDLTSEDLDRTLQQLRGSANGRWLRGIRHQVQDEHDPRWLVRDDVRRGLKVVADHNLVYDLLTLPHQLPAAAEIVERMPQAQFVLDHLSKPAIAEGDKTALKDWARDLRRLATSTNVSAKLSGLVTEAAWDRWTIEDIRPAAEVAIDAFGPERLLFGSDWPVCLLAASYDQVHDLAQSLVSDLAGADRRRIFGDNAAEIYRFDPLTA